MRVEETDEDYLPLTSMVVLKLKQEILYVPLDFDNNLTVNAFVDSGVYVSRIAQIDLDTAKQKAPFITLKTADPQNFQIQVADGRKKRHR